jgi:alanyl-tRNA synthetase
LFKILSEGAVAAGIRRIEGVTGHKALEVVKETERELQTLADILKVNVKDLPVKAEQLLTQLKEKEKEVEKLRAESQKQQVGQLLANVVEIGGLKILSVEVKASDMNELRSMADMFRDQLGSGVVVLGSQNEGKVNLVAAATKDAVQKGIHAGNIVREVAKKTGGGGGGRPDMAQAGGKDPAKLTEALKMVEILIKNQLH